VGGFFCGPTPSFPAGHVVKSSTVAAAIVQAVIPPHRCILVVRQQQLRLSQRLRMILSSAAPAN
jgi:hypothetical protein